MLKFPDYPDNWKDIIKRIKKRDKYRCRKCKKQFKSNSPYLKVHHIIPLSRGGTNHDSNLISECSDCHRKEHPHLQRLYEMGKTPLAKKPNYNKYQQGYKSKYNKFNKYK